MQDVILSLLDAAINQNVGALEGSDGRIRFVAGWRATLLRSKCQVATTLGVFEQALEEGAKEIFVPVRAFGITAIRRIMDRVQSDAIIYVEQ